MNKEWFRFQYHERLVWLMNVRFNKVYAIFRRMEELDPWMTNLSGL